MARKKLDDSVLNENDKTVLNDTSNAEEKPKSKRKKKELTPEEEEQKKHLQRQKRIIKSLEKTRNIEKNSLEEWVIEKVVPRIEENIDEITRISGFKEKYDPNENWMKYKNLERISNEDWNLLKDIVLQIRQDIKLVSLFGDIEDTYFKGRRKKNYSTVDYLHEMDRMRYIRSLIKAYSLENDKNWCYNKIYQHLSCMIRETNTTKI